VTSCRKLLGNIRVAFVSGNSFRSFNAVNTKSSHWKRFTAGSIHLPLSHNSFKTHLILSSHHFLCLPSSRFLKNFIIETFVLFLVTNILATCLVHPSILNFTIVATLGDAYKSQFPRYVIYWSSHVTQTILNPEIFLSTVIIFVFPKKKRTAKVIQKNWQNMNLWV
jgi:hypothetical protein